MAKAETPKLYTTLEVAELTGRQAKSIWALAKRRGLGQKIGRDLLFTAEEVQQIWSVDPRGGRPPADGGPVEHKVERDAIKKRGRKPAAEATPTES